MKGRYSLITVMVILITITAWIGHSYADIEPESIIGVWLFNENEDGIAVDSSENGNNGEMKNGATWGEGVFGEALELNGAGAHVEFGVNENLKPEHFTLVAWFNTRKVNGYGHIFQSGKDWTDMAGIVFRVHQDGYFQAAMATGPGDTASWCNGPNLSDETWYHAALTFDGVMLTLYIDGIREASVAAGKIFYDDRPVRIGVHPDDLGAAFDGFIDEVALFSEALPQEDIVDIMNDGLEAALRITAVCPGGKIATTWAKIRNFGF
jgi:hypothetical protein